jgi:hypothetical protein
MFTGLADGVAVIVPEFVALGTFAHIGTDTFAKGTIDHLNVTHGKTTTAIVLHIAWQAGAHIRFHAISALRTWLITLRHTHFGSFFSAVVVPVLAEAGIRRDTLSVATWWVANGRTGGIELDVALVTLALVRH